MRKESSIALLTGLALLVLAPVASLFVTTAAQASAARNTVWSDEERNILATLRLSQLPPAPRDPSNAVENSAAAIALGKRLFHDARFSGNQKVSCASCHDPDKAFQDGLPVGQGVGSGSRRTMPIVGAGYSPWLFWDGRKDSVWSQALGPLEDAVEHGGNRSRYAHLLQSHYRAEYEAVFQPMPELSRVPQDAGPAGTPAERAAWDAMDPASRQEVSRMFANMGKAIAAYEKTLAFSATRVDRYIEATMSGHKGTAATLTAQEQNGLRIFIGKGQCATCHNGPLFTDQQFHNTAVPQRDLSEPDHGRLAAIAKVKADEFNCLGAFSDARPEQCTELRFIVKEDKSLDGAFKTPSLRGVALRAPYMHAGQFKTLEEVVKHYVNAPPAQVGHTELAHGAAGHTERKPILLTEQEVADLVTFLQALSGPILETRQASMPANAKR
ncbi:MAG: cytochrome c peroxidase [Betaproteobacteria bacterium]